MAAWESKHIVNLELIISVYLWHHFIVKSLQKTPNTVCIDLHKGNANARVALVFHGPQGNPLGQCSEHIIRFLIPQSFDMAPVKCVLSAISVVFKFHVLPRDIHIGFFSLNNSPFAEMRYTTFLCLSPDSFNSSFFSLVKLFNEPLYYVYVKY